MATAKPHTGMRDALPVATVVLAAAAITGLGILPLTVLMVVMGDNFDMLPLWGWLALFAGGLVLWFALRMGLRRRAGEPAVEGVKTLGEG